MNIKSIVIVFLSIQLGACVPILSKGEYVLFDKTPMIEVLEKGIPEKRKFSPNRPILYELREDLYSIKISPGENGRMATFSTKSLQGEVLSLKLVNRSKQQIERACLFVSNEYNKPASQYLVLQPWNAGCEIYYDGVHSFDVAIIQGEKTLGIKKLFFELKKGGYYVWYDAV